jgi:hypothetical protein
MEEVCCYRLAIDPRSSERSTFSARNYGESTAVAQRGAFGMFVTFSEMDVN